MTNLEAIFYIDGVLIAIYLLIKIGKWIVK